jgi:hypothetical protein
MAANTVIETIRRRSAELDLDDNQISRLVSSDYSTWRNSVTEIEKALAPHELMIILVLSPAQIHALFPRRTTNIFALGHPRHLHRFRSTLWQRAASFLARTGFLCLAQNNHPIPAAVARRIALSACGESYPALESAECAEHIEQLFVFGDLPRATPAVYKLYPAKDQPGRMFYVDAGAGLFWQDLASCHHVGPGRRTLISLKYGRTETNIRAALRLGMLMDIFEIDQDPSAMSPKAREEWLFYKEWYHSPDGQEPPADRNRSELYSFYLAAAGAELAKTLPQKIGRRMVDYEWGAEMDVLDRLMPPGSVRRGEPVDAWAVLKTTMDQCLNAGVPHGIAAVVLRKIKPQERLRRPAVPHMAADEILTGYINPPEEWVDENAWAKVVNSATIEHRHHDDPVPRNLDLFLNL